MTTRERIYAAIAGYQASHDCAPSVREIGQLAEVSSPSVVHHHLSKLQQEGRVTWEPGKHRTLRLHIEDSEHGNNREEKP